MSVPVERLRSVRPMRALSAAVFIVVSLVVLRFAADDSGQPTGALLVPLLMALYSCARRARWRERDRFVFLFAAGSIVCAISGFAAAAIRPTQGAPTSAVVPNLFFLSSYPFAGLAVVAMIRARTVRRDIGHWLDGVLAAMTFGCLALSLFADEIAVAVADMSSREAAMYMAYPVLDAAVFGCMMMLIAQLGWRAGRLNVTMATAMMLVVVGDVVPLVEQRFGLAPGLAPRAFAAGYLLMFVGSLLKRPGSIVTDETNSPRRAMFGPWVSIAAATPLLLLRPTVAQHFAVAIGFVTVIAAMLRLSLAYRETRELHHTRREARTDELTSLPNRRALRERLDSLDVKDGPTSVLMMDLDGFKEVNDTLGHDAGDELLRTISARLHRTLRSRGLDGSLFRLGGDEFACVLPSSLASDRLIETLRESILAPISIHGVPIRQDVSIGAATFPTDAVTGNDLLRLADAAMYRAKHDRIGFALHRPDSSNGRDQLALAAGIRDAVERGAIDVHFQPQIELATGDLCGWEALLRLTLPSGPVSPMTVVKVCEQTGQLTRLTDLVLDRVLAEVSGRIGQHRNQPVSVNVGVKDMAGGDLLRRVEHALRRHDVSAQMLRLEMTEEALLGESTAVAATLDGLRRIGVCVSMDDFGVGFSSLTNLQGIVVDEIKIDQSFVARLHDGPRTAAIVETVVDLGRRLGATVVAEGIETEDQLIELRRLGVAVGQGYFIGRPMSAAAAAKWVSPSQANLVSAARQIL
jgi:diguanylate cyclase